jgi:putative transcriptional regulator
MSIMTDGLSGYLLVASPLMLDPNFTRTVVLILQHDDDGALGVVLNRPSDSPVSDHLPRWSKGSVEPATVFVGGPVSPEIGIGLAWRTGSGHGPLAGIEVFDLSAEDEEHEAVRVFAGYAGWGAGQLEAELEEPAWLVVPATPAEVFTARPDLLWGRVMRRIDPELGVVATLPPDPSLN